MSGTNAGSGSPSGPTTTTTSYSTFRNQGSRRRSRPGSAGADTSQENINVASSTTTSGLPQQPTTPTAGTTTTAIDSDSSSSQQTSPSSTQPMTPLAMEIARRRAEIIMANVQQPSDHKTLSDQQQRSRASGPTPTSNTSSRRTSTYRDDESSSTSNTSTAAPTPNYHNHNQDFTLMQMQHQYHNHALTAREQAGLTIRKINATSPTLSMRSINSFRDVVNERVTNTNTTINNGIPLSSIQSPTHHNNYDNNTLSRSPTSTTRSEVEAAALQRELHFAAEIGQYLLEQNQELERALAETRKEGEWLRSLLAGIDSRGTAGLNGSGGPGVTLGDREGGSSSSSFPYASPAGSGSNSNRGAQTQGQTQPHISSTHSRRYGHGHGHASVISTRATWNSYEATTSEDGLSSPIQQSYNNNIPPSASSRIPPPISSAGSSVVDRGAYDELLEQYALLQEELSDVSRDATMKQRRLRAAQSNIDALKREIDALTMELNLVKEDNRLLNIEQMRLRNAQDEEVARLKKGLLNDGQSPGKLKVAELEGEVARVKGELEEEKGVVEELKNFLKEAMDTVDALKGENRKLMENQRVGGEGVVAEVQTDPLTEEFLRVMLAAVGNSGTSHVTAGGIGGTFGSLSRRVTFSIPGGGGGSSIGVGGVPNVPADSEDEYEDSPIPTPDAKDQQLIEQQQQQEVSGTTSTSSNVNNGPDAIDAISSEKGAGAGVNAPGNNTNFNASLSESTSPSVSGGSAMGTGGIGTLAISPNISAIVKLMVGGFLKKYNKRRSKCARRFVNVNPYARTLSWSKKDPADETNTEVNTGG
ncbi:hypothetical protein HDU76_000651 [Blyttiomyces sp. JEL0837]|nr:hypothetical protein HDU76_000651 [Blyttiomyces sp. JEL0837]